MTKSKALKIGKIVGILVVVSAFLLLLLSSCDVGRYYEDDLKIKSPDGKWTLIIKEWGTIGGTGAKIYCSKKGSIFKKLLGETSADDVVYPFKKGYYTVEWEEDTVMIRYFAGETSIQKLDDPSTWETAQDELP